MALLSGQWNASARWTRPSVDVPSTQAFFRIIIGNNIDDDPPTSKRSNISNPRSTDLGTTAANNIKNDFEDVAPSYVFISCDIFEVGIPTRGFSSPGQ